jgi:hypothetical protein
MNEGDYKRGDVLVLIGHPFKFVVVSMDAFTLILNRLGSGIRAMTKRDADEKAIRVGTWDFEKDKEVDDG